MKNVRCMIGLHDKVQVHKSIDKVKFLRETLGRRDYNEWDLKALFKDMYGVELYIFDYHIIHDQVCIRCHKCFNKVDKFKERAISEIDFFKVKLKALERKTQIAQDLYDQNCDKK